MFKEKKLFFSRNLYKMTTMNTSYEIQTLSKSYFKEKWCSLVLEFKKRSRLPVQALLTHNYVALGVNTSFSSFFSSTDTPITTAQTFAPIGLKAPMSDSLFKAVDALKQCLDTQKIRNSKINLVISDCWSYPLVVSLKQTQLSDAETQVMLLGLYKKQYPELFNEFELSWDRQGTQIVCLAAFKKDLDYLKSELTVRGISTLSIKPLSLEILAKLGVKVKSSWIAVVEEMQLSLIRVENGLIWEWTTLSSESDLGQALSLNLIRYSSRSKDVCKSLMVFTVSSNPTKISNLSMETLIAANWRITDLSINELQKGEMGRLIGSIQKLKK